MDLQDRRYVSQWTPPTSARAGGNTGPQRKTYISAFDSDESESSYQNGDFLDQGSDLDETSRIDVSHTFHPQRTASRMSKLAWQKQSKEIDRFCSASENILDWIGHTLTASRQHALNLQHVAAEAATRKGKAQMGESSSVEGRRLLELQETFESVLGEKENIARELRAEKIEKTKLLRILHSLEAAAVTSGDGLSKTITMQGEQMHTLHSAAESYRPEPSVSFLDFESLRSPRPLNGVLRHGGSPTLLSGTAADALRPKDEAEKLKDSTLSFLRQQLKAMSYEKDQAQKMVQELEAQVKQLKQLSGERGIHSNGSTSQVSLEQRHATDGTNGRSLQLSTQNIELHSHVLGQAIETESPAVHPSLLMRPDGSPLVSAQQSSTDPFPTIQRGNSLTDPFPNLPWPPPAPPPAHMPASSQHLSPRGHATDASETASNTTMDSPRSLHTSTRGSHASAAARNAWPGFEVSADLVLYGEEEEEEQAAAAAAETEAVGRKRPPVLQSPAAESGRQVQQFVHSLHTAPSTPMAAPTYSPKVGAWKGDEGGKRATVQDMWSSFVQTQTPGRGEPREQNHAVEGGDDGWKVSPAGPKEGGEGQTGTGGGEGMAAQRPSVGYGSASASAYGGLARGPNAYAEGNGFGVVRIARTPPPSRGSPESMSNSQSRMRAIEEGWRDFKTSSGGFERKPEAGEGAREFSLREEAQETPATANAGGGGGVEEEQEVVVGSPTRVRRHSVGELQQFWASQGVGGAGAKKGVPSAPYAAARQAFANSTSISNRQAAPPLPRAHSAAPSSRPSQDKVPMWH